VSVLGDTEPRWFEYLNGELELGKGYDSLAVLLRGEVGFGFFEGRGGFQLCSWG
jgi:hypothetical protein